MRDEPSARSDERQADEPGSAPGSQPGLREPRHQVPPELLNVSFPVSMRGYDRDAVEAYVKRVNRVIAELKVSASPRAAVTHALEQTEQQVSGLLQRARDTGEEIVASARQEAEEIVSRAKAEAAELHVNISSEADAIKEEAEKVLADARSDGEDILARSQQEAESTRARSQAEAEERRRQLEEELEALREQAEVRMRELQTDTERVQEERRDLLADIRLRSSTLLEVADSAVARKPDAEPDEPKPAEDVERAGAERA